MAFHFAERHPSFTNASVVQIAISKKVVPGAGLEPARLSAQASKTCVATNYTTPANLQTRTKLRDTEIKIMKR